MVGRRQKKNRKRENFRLPLDFPFVYNLTIILQFINCHMLYIAIGTLNIDKCNT